MEPLEPIISVRLDNICDNENAREIFDIATKEEEDIQNKQLIDLACKINCENIGISKCKFINCKCENSNFDKVYMSDIIFQD